jgi:hypothetical protein
LRGDAGEILEAGWSLVECPAALDPRPELDGRMVYRLRPDASVSDDDMVDIVASTDCGDVVSISEELEAIIKNYRGNQD